MKFNKPIRIALISLSIAGLSIAFGAVYQVWATARDLKAYPAPGRMVDVNGSYYHVNCMGSGSPTVILEAGMGESSLSWYPVQAQIAKTTKVCAYDRAGLGWSEGGKHPMSPERVAASLRKLLENAAIESPFVLVGHSRGGLFCRRFYYQFPDEVKGMVLVDSVHDHAAARELPYARWDYLKQKIQITFALPLSRIGFIRITGWANADRQPSPLLADVLAAKTAVQNRTATARATVNEITVMRKSLTAPTTPLASVGNLPLVVLTSGKRIDVELAEQRALASNQSVENAVAVAQIERGLQQELAALSSDSKHIIAKNSGHFIMYDQPELVIRVVTDMVKASRGMG